MARIKRTFEVLDISRVAEMANKLDQLGANPAAQLPNLFHVDYDESRRGPIEGVLGEYLTEKWIKEANR